MTNMEKQEVISLLKAKQKKRSLRDFAQALGISPAYLSDIYRGRRDPGPAVLQLLGLAKKTETIYTKGRANDRD